MPKRFLSAVLAVHCRAVGPLKAVRANAVVVAGASILLLAAVGCQTSQTAQSPPQQSAQSPANEEPLAAVRQSSPSPTAAPSSLSPQPSALSPQLQNSPTGTQTNWGTNSLVLQEGDAVQISFPGAPTLNRTVAIRRDGKISLDMIGDIDAAGLTPNQLEKVLLEKYGPQLVVKEVNVTVVSSAFIIYVTGAVSRPGKLASERPLTPLQAIIEAGLDSSRSNLKAVKVIRTDDQGHTQRFKLNLKVIMDGKPFQPFALRPWDVIVVPEKFTWY